MFWHAAQKEIRNVDTLISVVHTFLTSLDLFTQFLRRESERERVTEEERKEDLGLREQREREGDLGAEGGEKEKKERGGLGTEERERETGGFPTSNEE